MNWKLIGKYTGFIFLATFIIGFGFGFVGQLIPQMADGFVLSMIATLIVIVIIFANLAIEQRNRTFVHALTIALLCGVITLLLNVGLLNQTLFEGAFSLIALLIMAAVGVGFGLVFRSRETKPNLPVREKVKNSSQTIRVAADTIVFCPYCRKNNRLHKGVLVGIKPVCANCKSPLELKEPLHDSFYNKYIKDEYVDVESYESRIIEPTVTVIERLSTNDNKIPNSGSRKTDDSTHEQINREETASEKLKQELFKLLNFNTEEANRIVNAKKIRFPGHSERWYWEKAIADENILRR